MMPQPYQQAQQPQQVITKKFETWKIVMTVAISLLVIYLISRTKLNANFWILISIGVIVAVVLVVMISLKTKELRRSMNEIIRLIQFNNKELPNPVFLDTSKVQVNEISPNNFLVHFVNDGLCYEVRDNIVTGMEFSNLYNSKNERERSILYRDIVQSAKKKESLLQQAEKLGVVLPDDS